MEVREYVETSYSSLVQQIKPGNLIDGVVGGSANRITRFTQIKQMFVQTKECITGTRILLRNKGTVSDHPYKAMSNF